MRPDPGAVAVDSPSAGTTIERTAAAPIDRPPPLSSRVSVDGKFFSCGAEPFPFRGVTYGTFRSRGDGALLPDAKTIESDMAAIGRAGFTVVRTYTPPSEDMLEYAGEAGLRVLASAFFEDWRYLLGASRRERAQWEWEVTELHYVSVEFLQQILRTELTSEWTELGCHPGYVSDDFQSVYLSEREHELRTLTDPRVRETIAELGIELRSYADYAAREEPGVTPRAARELPRR